MAAALLLLAVPAGWWLFNSEPLPSPAQMKAPVPLPAVVIAPVQIEPPQPEPEPAPVAKRPVKRVPPPPPPAQMRVGYLTADASPWAEVLLSGRVIDRTPFVRYPLPVGKHTLVFRGPAGEIRERAVSVAEGKTTSVRVDF